MFSTLLLFGSCNTLETEDLGNYSPDNVWNDSKLANAYLTDLYAGAFKGNEVWPVNFGTYADECLGISGSNLIQPTSGSPREFKYFKYSEIRDVNLLLESVPNGTLDSEEQKVLLGQAYFLRAWHYFKSLRVHGGMPIIDKVQLATDDLLVKRNSSLECFDFIIKDLDAAATMLPVKYSGGDYGRIDQCIVAAFKGRVLLYKASPQFNPSKAYSNSYLAEAYAATKAAKELLEANSYGLISNYGDIFETEGHSEAVFAVVFKAPSRVDGRQEYFVRPLSESKNGSGYDQPTWDFVEAYTMKDGKKIGESSKYTYDDQTFWENRDPRFEASIVHNASVFELSGKTDRRQYTTANIASSLDAFGVGIQGESFSRTGMFCRKAITEELPSTQVDQNDIDWLEIRFAEVLFNYAEMANEKGEVSEAYDVLKSIRMRAGIEAGDDGLFGLQAGMSKEQMRTALLDEKRIEFSFEGHRFWDLRRHRLLHTYLHGQTKRGCLATLKSTINPDEAVKLAADYKLMPTDFTYSFPDIALMYDKNAEYQMHTPESYYFFPIHKDELDKNSNLEQNEGWGGSFKGAIQ